MNIGIVGHAADKFTPETEAQARKLIIELLSPPGSVLVSGHCHLGGIDIYAEEEADALGRTKIIHPPAKRDWTNGYRPRNILIARDSDQIHNIVVANYPPNYRGMRFDNCYHCHTNTHIKSGGCWTTRYAQRLGKPGIWHIIQNNPAWS